MSPPRPGSWTLFGYAGAPELLAAAPGRIATDVSSTGFLESRRWRRALPAMLLCLGLLAAKGSWATKASSPLHLEVVAAAPDRSMVTIRMWSDIALPVVRVAVIAERGRRRELAITSLDAGAVARLDVAFSPRDRAVVATAGRDGSRLAAVAPLRAEAKRREASLMSVSPQSRRYSSAGRRPRRLDAAPRGRLVLKGAVTYEDEIHDINGIVGLVPKPLRYARVEAVDAADGRVLAGTHSDKNGRYQLKCVACASVAVRLVASSFGMLPQYPISVFDDMEGLRVFAVVSAEVAVQSGTLQVDLFATEAAANAFNIFDQGVRGFDYIRTLSRAKPPLLVFFWRPDATDGTYFGHDDAVHLLGKATDNDAMDDDIVLHEIGHFYQFHYSRDDSPGGPHNAFDTDQDPRLSWSEGFANYFSSAVRNEATYVDTLGPAPPFALEWEEGTDEWLGPNSESAVTMALWDTHDPRGGAESFDGLSGRDRDVGRVNQEFLVRQAEVDVTSFCPGWKALRIRDYATLQAVFDARVIPCP